MTGPRWATVLQAWLGEAESDSVVQGLLGDGYQIAMAGERKFAVPSSDYSILSAGIPGELWEPLLIQLDWWMSSMDALLTLEHAYRRLYHHDLPVTFGGVQMWSMLTGDERLPAVKDGIWSRALTFRLTSLRGRYVPA